MARAREELQNAPGTLGAASAYALSGGGKLLRPLMLLLAAELFQPPEWVLAHLLPASAAVECLHTYSLVHDDLPCMDNDDLRRGRPTVHRAFDEPTALLVGDALLTFSFELLTRMSDLPPQHIVQALTELAQAAGAFGMIGGQQLDMQAERDAVLTTEGSEQIAQLKTARMFAAAAAMGAQLAAAPVTDIEALRGFGLHFGQAFQALDDLLDALGDAQAMGKGVAKDLQNNKKNLIWAMGIERTQRFAQSESALALTYLDVFDERADALRKLTHLCLERTH